MERLNNNFQDGTISNHTLEDSSKSIESSETQLDYAQEQLEGTLAPSIDELLSKNDATSIEEPETDSGEGDERTWMDKTSDFFINSPVSDFIDNNISTPIIEGARKFRDTFGDSIDQIDEALGTNLGEISTLVDIHDMAQEKIHDPALQEAFDKLFRIER